MPEQNFIPLQVANDKESSVCWNDFPSPDALVNWLQKRLFVSGERLESSDGIVASNNKPSASDAGKIWVKTGEPYGLGFFIDGEYQMFYQYDVDIPFVWLNDKGTIPAGVRELTNTEISTYGLSLPKGGKLVIFEKPAI